MILCVSVGVCIPSTYEFEAIFKDNEDNVPFLSMLTVYYPPARPIEGTRI